MEKITIVDYIASSDSRGNPVGHSLKVLKEIKSMVEEENEIEIIAPVNYLTEIDTKHRKKLFFYVNVTKGKDNILKNIKCMLVSFFNIFTVFCRSTNELIWFCNVNQFLFMYLGIFGFHKKKIIISLIANEYSKKYHNYFFKKVLPKIHLIVNSNGNSQYRGKNCMFVPDYLYRETYYQKYKKSGKLSKVVCIGTMSRVKNIKEMVEIFNKINYPLEIYGLFYEENYYKEIMAIKNHNIKITNRYLEYEEYLKVLAEAKFSILPYDEQAYKNVTSGVILESIFLDTIPITNHMLLQNMGIQGIAYKDIIELGHGEWYNEDYLQIIKSNRVLITKQYDENKYKNILISKLTNI